MSLVAQNISLRIDDHVRLDNISCSIEPGQLTIIIGSNGSGKTSLIKILAAELKPSTGNVYLDDIALEQWSHNALAQRRAVLPQHAALDFPFRVHDVIALGRSPYLRNQRADAELIKQAMKLFDVLEFAQRLYTTLSGGERQRVHLARVWVQVSDFNPSLPAYLLLDEPTSALDLKHQMGLMGVLTNAARVHNLAIVAALHDLQVAARYADQLILLKHGAMIASGAPEVVLTPCNIEHVYGVPVELLHYKANGGKQVIAMPS